MSAETPTSADTASAENALEFARSLAQATSRTLAGAVAGVVLHGSLVLGDYRAGRSDVDLLAVVRGPLILTQLDALAEAVRGVAAWTPIRADLRVVTHAVAARPTPLPQMETHLRVNSRSDPSLGVEGRHSVERDLVVELSVCRAHGRSLVGAPPTELIGPVPDEWVLDVGDAQLADWQAIGDDPPYAELTVLTACRLWRFADEGRHCSKDSAGEWALSRDPRLEVVRDALRQRRSDYTHPIDSAEVQNLLAFVRGHTTRGGTLANPQL